MIAIDTNIIIRFLETEWVLRFSYKLSSERIVFALSNLLGLENIVSENKERIIIALQWHEQGMDFADALHLSFSLHTQAFLSFDKKMMNKASLLNIDIKVIEP